MAAHPETRDRSPKGIFLDALEIASPGERLAFLDSRCGGDARLRAEVEELLHHHGRLGDYLEGPAPDPEATRGAVEPPHEPAIGSVIGPYTVREQIGEGGMGVVYVAEQA